jgi:hypothetical protein
MVSLLLLTATLGLPANQGGSLALSNVRSTHGVMGPARAEDKLLPGDALFVAFDIEGITVDGAGKFAYSIVTEVSDAGGRMAFKQDPKELAGTTSLGGSRVPGYAELRIGLDQEPGDYTLKVTVTDSAARRSQSVTRPFTVLKKDFGIVRLALTSDADGLLPVPVVGIGQPLWVHYGIVGFTRGTDKQPQVNIEVRIVDDSGKATTAKPIAGSITKGVPESLVALPMNFLLSPNRSGKFTVEVTATDTLARKSAKLSFPLTVYEAK